MTTSSTALRRRSNGPNPAFLAGVCLGLTVGAIVVGAVLAGGQPYPSPFRSTGGLLAYLRGDQTAARFVAALQFAVGTPLGILAASLSARLNHLGVRVAGPTIALYGGISAATMQAISGLASWVTTVPDVAADDSVTRALLVLSFVTGGPGFVLGLGLLVAGVAVPALILRLVPRWFAVVGIVVASLSELAFFGLIFDQAQFLLPVGRFGGLVWLIAAGILLPLDRRDVRDGR